MREVHMCVVILVCCGAAACRSGAENPAGEAAVETPPLSIAADGSMHVSPAAVKATGLQVAQIVERNVAQTLVTIGRVKPRAGAEAEVAPPFAGTVVTQSVLPKIGDVVRKSQHLADIEQQFAASERLRLSRRGFVGVWRVRASATRVGRRLPPGTPIEHRAP